MRSPFGEVGAMGEEAKRTLGRAVVVVGVDLSDVSEHLLTNARDLVRTVDDVEFHIVHVIRPESLRERLTEPMRSPAHVAEQSQIESARWQIQRMCVELLHRPGAKWFVHTPVGDASAQLSDLARTVGADVIVIEAHDHPSRGRLFHRSAVVRIFQDAPCSVIAIRRKTTGVSRPAVVEEARDN
jgi:nucleotide-binding universal stress UspA family protein